jgi:hypothetical protein
MVIMLWLILGLGAVAILALAAVIALPLHLRLWAERSEGAGAAFRMTGEVRLLGGLAPPLRFVGGDDVAHAETPTPRPAKAAKKKRDRTGWRRMPVSRILSALPDLAGGVLRRIHIDRLEVDTDFGLDDPADTGVVYGCMMPLIHGIRSKRLALNLRPDFTQARFAGRAEAALHLTPGAFAWPAARFAWRVWVARR